MAKEEVFMIGDVAVPIDEFRRRWLEALRSGEYKQTRERLKDQCGYCCLGVAVETLRKMQVPLAWRQPVNLDCEDLVLADHLSEGELPDRFDTLLGTSQNTCISWNDYEKASFAEIADYLEHHWEEAEASNVVGE